MGYYFSTERYISPRCNNNDLKRSQMDASRPFGRAVTVPTKTGGLKAHPYDMGGATYGYNSNHSICFEVISQKEGII